MLQRLDKLVAGATQYSRKQAAALIKSGRVQVSSRIVTSPDFSCPEDVLLSLDGLPLTIGSRFYMLNKPVGVVCATRDSSESTVLDLLPKGLRKNLFPAGRLDKDAEGFVLLTDDGPFAHRLLSPKSKVPKTYRATLDKAPDDALLSALFSKPMDLGGGDITSPAQLGPIEGSVAQLTIYEGIYHQVKRMFLRAGYRVERLERIRIGLLDLDPGLSPSKFRALTPAEQTLLTTKNAPD